MDSVPMLPDPRAILAQAANLHRAGRMEEAIAGFREAARMAPGFVDAHRMLAMALLQTGQAKEAVQSAKAAAHLAPNDPHAQMLLGAGLQAAGQGEKALSAFERAGKLAPAFSEAQFQAGNALAALGRLKEAVLRYSRALELDPRALEALANRSVALARLGRHAEALADCERLIVLQPWTPMHHINKGGILLESGDLAGAATAATQALAAFPDDADALALLGQSRFAAMDLAGARAAFEQAVAAHPGRADIRLPLAQVLRRTEQFTAALAQCEAALETHPALAGALYERGETKRALEDFSGALTDLDAALALEPRLTVAHVARATVLADLGRAGEIRAALDKGLRTNPNHPDARFAAAMDELARGRWLKGWEGYEARGDIVPPTFTALPFTRWDGKDTPSELVVLGEQGFGDAIQFARLLPLLAARGFPVRFLTRTPLVPLLSRIDARVRVVSDLDDLDATTAGLRWVPLGSLPRLLASDPLGWPSVPYLEAEPARVSQWRHVRDAGPFLVGITWQGSPKRDIDVGRSAPLEAFAPLSRIPGVKLIAMQQGAGAEQLDTASFKGKVLRLEPDFDADGAFLDSAALLQHLDLVVTTDTSMAHLAGALGRPVLLALKAVPDWRWGREGTASVFYPTAQLVRQSTPGDWDGVFATIAAQVEARVAQKQQAQQDQQTGDEA